MKKGMTTLIMVAWILVIAFVTVIVALGANSSFYLLKEETLSMQDISSVVLHNDRKNIEVIAAETAQAKVRQYGRRSMAAKDQFTIDIENGCATIDCMSQFEILDLWTAYERIVIEIPASWIGDIEINSKSGGISVEDSFAWKNVNINCTSGGISFVEKLIAENINMNITSGNIKANGELIAAGAINVESTSGEIRFNMPIKSNDIDIKASSGSITLDTVDTTDLRIKNSSGAIILGETKTGNFDIANSSGRIKAAGISGSGNMKTSSGNITVRLDDPVGTVNLDVKSGSINITVDASLEFRFSGQCTSGSVRANFPLEGGGNKASATVGNNPNASITATATSGGIKINQE